MSYAVISPVKNEAEFIELTIESMILQTVKPAVWVIVNDGSQDKTESIVRKYAEENDWIKLVNRQGSTVRKRGKGVVEAFYAGFETLQQEFDFIVKMDGDVSFNPDYFESLFHEFDLDPQLGIAGGGLYEKPEGKSWVLLTSKDHVRGCTKIYRRKCFQAIGGLVPSMGWDGIDEWKALAMGWKIQSFLDIKIYHYRYTGAATGYLKSWIEQGNGAYRMGYHPLFMFARGFRRMTERPYVIGGLAMVASYILSWFRREEMLAEPFVVNYIRRTQMKKLIGLLSGKPVHE
ncbi:MAG: glycosyltransferase family 2 protein [Anaerolineaceae bacterium]